MPSSGTWLINDGYVENLVKWQLTFLFPKLFAYKKNKINFFVSQDSLFVYIERKVVHFKIPEEEDQEEDEECCQWIYACSCNQKQTSIVSALRSNVNLTFKGNT